MKKFYYILILLLIIILFTNGCSNNIPQIGYAKIITKISYILVDAHLRVYNSNDEKVFSGYAYGGSKEIELSPGQYSVTASYSVDNGDGTYQTYGQSTDFTIEKDTVTTITLYLEKGGIVAP